MRIEAATPDEYFSKSGEREPTLRRIDELIRSKAPSLERSMVTSPTMNMVGYGMFHYVGKSGREGDWPVIALANQKNYISLYICALEEGEYIAEKNADKLGNVSVGKSCVRFKKIEDLDLEFLGEILDILEQRIKNGEAVYGL